MRSLLLACVAGCFAVSLAHAQTDVLIEVELERKQGDQPVRMRAILSKPERATDTALLFFRGVPGYALINSVQDKKRNLGWMGRGKVQSLLMQAGIAFVIVDCPTDQWGESPKPPATNCLHQYRFSRQHADDVRRLIAHLKEKHGLSRQFLLGHSMGTVSSRSLAIHLGKDEVAGIIHSATINFPNPNRGNILQLYGDFSGIFPRKAAGMPMLHLHNENDACPGTPYAPVRAYAQDNLVTVRGGLPEGEPCGVGHLHSHQGREDVAIAAVITWIKTGKVEPVVGE